MVFSLGKGKVTWALLLLCPAALAVEDTPSVRCGTVPSEIDQAGVAAENPQCCDAPSIKVRFCLAKTEPVGDDFSVTVSLEALEDTDRSLRPLADLRAAGGAPQISAVRGTIESAAVANVRSKHGGSLAGFPFPVPEAPARKPLLERAPVAAAAPLVHNVLSSKEVTLTRENPTAEISRPPKGSDPSYYTGGIKAVYESGGRVILTAGLVSYNTPLAPMCAFDGFVAVLGGSPTATLPQSHCAAPCDGRTCREFSEICAYPDGGGGVWVATRIEGVVQNLDYIEPNVGPVQVMQKYSFPLVASCRAPQAGTAAYGEIKWSVVANPKTGMYDVVIGEGSMIAERNGVLHFTGPHVFVSFEP